MDSYLNSIVLDKGLEYLKTNADKLYLCSNMPITYIQATATPPTAGQYALGLKTFGVGNVFPNAIVDAINPFGRKITTQSFVDGASIYEGIAMYWAIVDSVHQILFASNKLITPQGLAIGYNFTLSEFDVTIATSL